MKFLLAAAALIVGASAAPGSVRKINSAAASPKLMSKSMKYSDFVAKHGQTARKLEQQEWEITGDYSIVPQECVNFAVQTDNIYDENIISYAASGEAVAEKSYVIFQVVKSNVDYYEDGSDDYKWIAPLGDFMEAMVMYKTAVKENYCEQCQRSEEYCYYQKNGMTQEEAEQAEQEQEEQQNEQQNEQEGEQEGDDEGRKLKAFERKLSGNYVNCNQCDAYGCWEEEEQEGQEQQEDDYYLDDEEIGNYVAEIAGCADSGIMTSSGIELKVGFLCGNRSGKSGGTGTYGPELALFLDDECTVYYKSMDYYSVATSGQQYNNQAANNGEGRKLQDQVVLTSSQLEEITSMVVDPYSAGIACEAFPEFDEWNQDGDQQEEEQNQEEENEANEICQQIMQAEAVPLATCGYDNNQEQEEAEEEAEDEWEANNYNFLWEYELTQDEVDDIAAVCTFYNTYDFEAYQGNVYEGETHYKPPKSGTFSMDGLTAGAKAAIALIVLAVVGGIAFFALKKKKSDDDYKLEPLHDKGTSA